MMFNKNNFSSEVLNSSGLILVDFFASWCGPCQALAPVIEGLAKEYEGRVKIGKLNTEDAIEIAQQYGVMSVPTLIFFKNGKEIKRLMGFHSREELIVEIDALNK